MVAHSNAPKAAGCITTWIAPVRTKLGPSATPNVDGWELKVLQQETLEKFSGKFRRKKFGFFSKQVKQLVFLFWEDLNSTIAQFDAELKLTKEYFLYADYGFGVITDVKLTDKDFLTTGTEFSKTISNGDDGDSWYLNIHLGRKLIRSQNGKGLIRGFIGYQHWEEEIYDKGSSSEYILFGVDITPFDTTDPNQKGITWNYSFDSIKLGLDGEYAITNTIKVSSLVVYIPYAELDAKDFHHLREGPSSADAGSPFVTWTGSGAGFNLEGSISYQFYPNWIFSTGYRYWYLSSEGNDATFHFGDGSENSTSREIDFDIKRYGATLGITFTF